MLLRDLTLAAVLVGSGVLVNAATASSVTKIKFAFQNADVNQIIEVYAKASGQKFIIDPTVRGKATILAPKEMSLEDAFAMLSSALATNNVALSEQGDTMVAMSARNVQRSLIPVVSELPPLKPERMVSMIFTLKNTSAEEVNKRLRIFPSRDGEMSPYEPGQKLIVTDWVSNMHRIAKMVAEIDQPAVAPAAQAPAPANK